MEDVVEVVFVEDDESVQNLVLQSLNHSFNVCPQIGCPGWHLWDFDIRLAEDLIEGGRVFDIVDSH